MILLLISTLSKSNRVFSLICLILHFSLKKIIIKPLISLNITPRYSKSTHKMSNAHKSYLNAVRHSLNATMCLQNFESRVTERQNKPEVEKK